MSKCSYGLKGQGILDKKFSPKGQVNIAQGDALGKEIAQSNKRPERAG
jgi:hypothetical protein